MALRTCIEVLRENQNTGANKVGKPVTDGTENMHRGVEGKTRTRVLTRWVNQSLMALRTCIEVLRENQNTGANKVGKPVTDGTENMYRGAEGKPEHRC